MRASRRECTCACHVGVRWRQFVQRPGDIIISTRPKSGTTWMQMICALLVFQTPDLPLPLPQLSPWLDGGPVAWAETAELLANQEHRRFIKTHTPLTGLPMHPALAYIVVARHPLDAALSLYYQADNGWSAQLDFMKPNRPNRLSPRDWLLRWMEWQEEPIQAMQNLNFLPGVLWHLSDAWDRRRWANVLLVHYDDLLLDLEREMRRIAGWLDITVAESEWPALVQAADFKAMRLRADELAPDPAGRFRDRTAFFRSGSSGGARELLSREEIARYHERAREFAEEDLLAWLHRDSWMACRPPASRCAENTRSLVLSTPSGRPRRILTGEEV